MQDPPIDINERFDVAEGNFNKFDRVVNKRSQRPDLCAFLLLDAVFPQPGCDMVSGAEHDQIWLGVEGDLDTLTDDQILVLVRCGVCYDSEDECLFMFA